MKYRVMMRVNTPGRSRFDRVTFTVPLYSAAYDTLTEAVEVVQVLMRTGLDRAITSYTLQEGTPGTLNGAYVRWQEMTYGEWAELLADRS